MLFGNQGIFFNKICTITKWVSANARQPAFHDLRQQDRCYDNNNSCPTGSVPRATLRPTSIDAEILSPLMQVRHGSSIESRPGARPAKSMALLSPGADDINLAEFDSKRAVGRFVGGCGERYWICIFAYRDLEAKIAARDPSPRTLCNALRSMPTSSVMSPQAEEQSLPLPAEIIYAVERDPDDRKHEPKQRWPAAAHSVPVGGVRYNGRTCVS